MSKGKDAGLINDNKLKKYDEDIVLLLEKSDLAKFDYRNLSQLERLKAIGARWPLLAELRPQQRDPSP